MTLSNSLSKMIRSATHTKFSSPQSFYMKRTRMGQINEFFKRLIIASDRVSYCPPFLSNWFREANMMNMWADLEDADRYNYLEDDRCAQAEARFEFMYNMIKERIEKDTSIVDVGCNSGFFLQRFHERGYTNLYGIDPQKTAIELAGETRSYIKMTEGFFGPKENDIPCDMLIFFGVLSRIPYHAELFKSIARNANKYVLMWTQESMDDFIRDVHVGMAREGYLCIEKRVVDESFKPVGTGDEPLFSLSENIFDPPYHSYFLFRRVEVRK